MVYMLCKRFYICIHGLFMMHQMVFELMQLAGTEEF